MNKALTYILDSKKRPIWWRAFRQWQRRPPTLAPLAETHHHCASCGDEYQGNYCPRCGQSGQVGRFSFKKALMLFLDVWGMGNRSMFRSLRDLILRPGYLIRDYISGMQSAYFPPFKMFFVLAALAVLVEHGCSMTPTDSGANLENGQVVVEQVDVDDDDDNQVATSTELSNPEDSTMTIKVHGKVVEPKMYQQGLKFAQFMDSLREKNPTIFALFSLLLFSWPLFFFLRRSPTIPDLRFSEFVVALVYTSNTYSIFSIAGKMLSSSLLAILALIMVFVALKQFSGYSMKRLLGYIILTAIISFIVFGTAFGIGLFITYKIT